MQYDSATPFTVKYRAISVRQPYADEVAFGKTDHLLLGKSTGYRGELLVVSSPSRSKERSGMAICKAVLDDVKKVEGGYLWKFSNVRRVVEVPCQKSTMRGTVWDCHYTDGEIVEYPRGNVRPFLHMPEFEEVK